MENLPTRISQNFMVNTLTAFSTGGIILYMSFDLTYFIGLIAVNYLH